MNKFIKKIIGATLGLAMAAGVGVAIGSTKEAVQAKATPAQIAGYTFEANGAHRPNTNNSYGTNQYSENGTNDINLTYADSVTTGTPLTGSANVLARVAKNTTNSPSIVLGPLNLSAYNVTGVTYKVKGVAAFTLTSSYSKDNTNWTTIAAHNPVPTSATVLGSNSNIASPVSDASTFYVKLQITVASSTNSNRDAQIDDIIIYGESASSGPVASSVSIDDVENNELDIYTETPTNFTATYVLGDDGVSLRWSVSDETCEYELSETSGDATTFTASSAGDALLTVDVLDDSDNVLASDYVVITATVSPYVFGTSTINFSSGAFELIGDIGDYFEYEVLENDAANAPGDKGNDMRIYPKSSITFSSKDDNVDILSIDMTASSKDGGTSMSVSASCGSPSSLSVTSSSAVSLETWTAPADCDEVTFTCSTGQFRLFTATIRYQKLKVPSINVGGLTTLNASTRVSNSSRLDLVTEYVDLAECTIDGASGYASYVTPSIDVEHSQLVLTGVAKTESPIAVYIKLSSTTLLTVNVTVSNNVITASVKSVIEVGEDASITASSSEYVSDTYSFSSSDSSIASVTSAGVVTGERIGGPVSITITSNTDGSSTIVSVSVVKATTLIAKAGTMFDFGSTTLPANWSGTSVIYYGAVQSLQADGQKIENDKIGPSSGLMRVVRVSLHAFTSTGGTGVVKVELLKDGAPIEGSSALLTTTIVGGTNNDNVNDKLDEVDPLVADLTAADFNGIRLSGTNSAKICLGELTISYFESVAEEADDWALSFLSITEGHCSQNSNTVAEVWSAASAAYAKYTAAAKALFVAKITATNGEPDGTTLGNAAARFYWAVTNHNGSNNDFTESGLFGSLVGPASALEATGNGILAISVVSLAAAVTAGAFFILRKRKQQEL